MKKVLSILLAFLGLGILTCFIVALCLPCPAEVYKTSQFAYKFCTSLQYFLIFFPGMILTSFIVGFSVQFGSNSEGSYERFSSAMFKRYKTVMIISLACTFLLTLANETLGVVAGAKKTQILNRPKIVNEYIKVGKDLFSKGYYERSIKYADAAIKLNSKAEEALKLKNDASLEISKKDLPGLHFNSENIDSVLSKTEEKKYDPQELLQSYEYYQKAQTAFDNAQWFDAHYYAELGIKLNAKKDPNYEKLRDISVQSWNNLTNLHKNSKTDSQLLFEEKYKGYVALTQGDDLQAYYIFRRLIEDSQYKKDNDVNFYYDVASKRVEEKYFFVDETFELKSFEKANDVYFTYQREQGSKNIVYFKGMTEVENSGQSIQYLRDLTILTFTADGKWFNAMHVDYAKVMPVFVENLSKETKELLEIQDGIETVPYMLLKSVGRDDSSIMYKPDFTYADGVSRDDKDFIIFPMDFADFILVENSNKNVNDISLVNLWKITSKAKDFGYSKEIFGQVLLNRLLYPLCMLVLLVLLASFAWNNRVNDNQYFKFTWFLAFPFFIVTAVVLNQLVMWGFKLLNYVLLTFNDSLSGLLIGCGIYVVLFFAVSVFFLSRNTSN